MFNKFGFSVYISSFDRQKQMLKEFKGSGYYVFTSFHIQEEYRQMEDYTDRAWELCKWLKEGDFKIIGDVSRKTLEFFEYESLIDFARDFNLYILRLDFGFSDEEIIEISKEFPVSFNPSTEDEVVAKKILGGGGEVYALHNFYPRPETALDDDFLLDANSKLKNLGIRTLAFIAGDEEKRGPIKQGLPTLERHRSLPPYVAFLDLLINFETDLVFVGDVKISKTQGKLIVNYLNGGIIDIPVEFSPNYEYLYNQIFTIRADSPHGLMRLQESREYSSDGAKTQPFNCISRERGSITMDNVNYKRYSGEIQILRKSLPQDDRVNLIGRVNQEYLGIMDCIKNKKKIRFIDSKLLSQ